MLKEAAIKYYRMGYNCAESMIHAGNEVYNLGLCEHDMRMTACLGGGLMVKDVCGALLGSICAISCKYIETKANDHQPEVKLIAEKMVYAFERELGSRLCKDLKPSPFPKDVKCERVVGDCADVLAQVISEWDKERESVLANITK